MIPAFYNSPIKQGELTLSVDNIVADFHVADTIVRNRLPELMKLLPDSHYVDVVSWDSFRPGTFKLQFSIRHADGTSFWLGVGLISSSVTWGRCRLEFNPNKVANSTALHTLLDFFLERTQGIQRKIARFDLAVDIPLQRQHCFLIKDKRLYIERRHGQEYTQYLGAKSSAVGRVKLYNKQAESNLSNPLTRLELTLDPSVPYGEIPFPVVYYLAPSDVQSDVKKVTATDRFILNAVLQGYGSLTDLGRKTRVKIEALMQSSVSRVDILPESYQSILAQLQSYVPNA